MEILLTDADARILKNLAMSAQTSERQLIAVQQKRDEDHAALRDYLDVISSREGVQIPDEVRIDLKQRKIVDAPAQVAQEGTGR